MSEEVTIKELEEKIEECFTLKEEHAIAKKAVGELYAVLEKKKDHVIGLLDNIGKQSYTAETGIFRSKEHQTFRVPKDEENRQKFFGHLKVKGLFEKMITVPSTTINAWAKLEVEAAEKKGVLDYQIPGLEKSEMIMKASMTKKRK